MPLYSLPELNAAVFSAFTVTTESLVRLKNSRLQESCSVKYQAGQLKFPDNIDVINYGTIYFLSFRTLPNC